MDHSDFYPRPPRGGRPIRRRVERWINQFLSTPSARRATSSGESILPLEEISIHALREEGDKKADKTDLETERISIHALREEGDSSHVFKAAVIKVISIHALREEGDPAYQVANPNLGVFLSTPSARRATAKIDCPHGAFSISIHALREEGDHARWITTTALRTFLSTPSARRAT